MSDLPIRAVDGRRDAYVAPPTYAFPNPSTATASGSVEPSVPPRYVEYNNADPVGLILATNPSQRSPSACGCDWKAFTTGKSVDCVIPTTYALPVASTAIPLPSSGQVRPLSNPTRLLLPPRYVA